MTPPKKPRIVVADDEPNLRKVLSAILSRDGYEVLEASDGEAALALVDSSIAAVITELRMPKLDGMGLLRRIVAEHPDVPVIMITAHGSVDSAVEAVKLGAFDYLEKPFEQTQIRQVVQKAQKTHELDRRAPRPMPPTAGSGRFGLVGRAAPLEQVFAVIEKVADTPSTVLITGESGTGKELFARALHENSSRHAGPFIKINCAAIPKTLMESELFGYDKGAFTGAVGQKPGRFELADGGTLFLDEIGEIPVEMQVKLLRAIQESEFERVGGIKTIKVDVRLVTATNRDLELETQRGNFREDLFYRLNVVPLLIPPLRKRTGDIPLLVAHIVKKFNERLKKSISGVTDDALAALEAHTWPGNIRELENVLERTILFSKSDRIERTDLQLAGANDPAHAAHAAAHVAPAAPITGSMPAIAVPPGFDDDDDPVGGEHAGSPSGSLKDIVRAETSRVERELIVKALEETGGNVTQAARLLKISRKSLQMKMKELGLRDKDA